MYKRSKLLIILVLLASGFSCFSYGQLFTATEEATFSTVIGSGARAFGMGGAFIAVADDATASSFNPAGLGQLVYPEASAVFAVNKFVTDYPEQVLVTDANGSNIRVSPNSITRSGNNLDFLSVTYPVRSGTINVVPQFSYQRYVNLGFTSELDPNYFEREEVYFPGLQSGPDVYELTERSEGSFSGGYDVYTASLGVKVSEKLSLGIATNLWRNGQSGSNLASSDTSAVIFVDNDGDGFFETPTNFSNNARTELETSSSISGFNLNLGILFKPHLRWSIGAIFKTPFTISADEEIEFTDRINSLNNLSGTISSEIEYPYSIGFGSAINITDQLTISGDYTLSKWSSGKLKNQKFVSTDGIEVELEDRPFPGNGLDSLDRPIDQENTAQFRFGSEYVFVANQILLPIRAGFYTNSQYLTDGNDDQIRYYGFSFGAGIVINNILLDAAFVRESGNSFFSSFSNGDRDFSSSQLYFSAIIRLK